MTTPCLATSMSYAAYFRSVLTGSSPEQRAIFCASLRSKTESEALATWWDVLALQHQRPPLAAANGEPWRTWLLMGGRGAGKTRAGAAWVRALATGNVEFAGPPAKRIAIVGETWQDAREVMVEGEAGLLRIHPPRD